MARATQEPRLVLARDVATALGCSTKRVRQISANGLLEAVRLSPRGHLRFRAEDVERLIRGGNKPS